MADTAKGDTQILPANPRLRDTSNHFSVRRRGPTTPVLFTVTTDDGQTYVIGIDDDMARNLAGWLVVVSETKAVDFLELVNFIKA